MVKISDRRADQKSEDKSTGQALKRWAEGQRELWTGDLEKTFRVMARVENELMSQPEIAEMCNDRADRARRSQFANSVGFFFDRKFRRGEDPGLRADLERWTGLFEVFKEARRPRDEFISFWPGHYCRFELPERGNFLLVQEFDIDHPTSGGTIFTRRHSGFAFLGSGKRFTRFMISRVDPAVRWIETWGPEDATRIYSGDAMRQDSKIRPDDLVFFINRTAVDDRTQRYMDELHQRHDRFVILRKMKADAAKFINNGFSRVMWDIPL